MTTRVTIMITWLEEEPRVTLSVYLIDLYIILVTGHNVNTLVLSRHKFKFDNTTMS